MLVNQTGRTIKEGEQVFFFYGRFTNAYLLINYGFAYPDNKYDSVEVNVEMKPNGFRAKEFVSFDYSKVEGLQVFKVKKDMVHVNMLCYLRLLV